MLHSYVVVHMYLHIYVCICTVTQAPLDVGSIRDVSCKGHTSPYHVYPFSHRVCNRIRARLERKKKKETAKEEKEGKRD